MSILILQGLHPASAPLPSPFLLELRRLAQAVGRNLELRPFLYLKRE